MIHRRVRVEPVRRLVDIEGKDLRHLISLTLLMFPIVTPRDVEVQIHRSRAATLVGCKDSFRFFFVLDVTCYGLVTTAC